MTPYKFLVGFVLTVAMVAVLALGALAFSARDFQYGIAQLSEDGKHNGLISFTHLDQVEQQVAQLREETRGPRGELNEVNAAIEAAEARAAAARSQASEVSALVVRDAAGIEERARVENAVTDTSAQGLSQRLGALGGRSLTPADQQALVGLNAQVQDLARTEEAIDAAETERAALLTRQRALGAAVAESNSMIAALQLDVVPDPDHYERIRGEVTALRNISPFHITESLAQGHPALLSTVLVLLMGALGSLLYLFPAYLNRAVPVTMAEIVVRLIFGMCAALAVYVLANAAVEGFSMGSAPGEATTSAMLNPFTVSLVGIVAGVLSEDIAQWIQERGRGIFQQGGVSAGRPQSGADEGMVNPHAIT